MTKDYRLRKFGSKAAKVLLAGAMVSAFAPGMAFAAAGDGTVENPDLAESTDGTAKGIMWPDGKWATYDDKTGIYKWKTYIKGDESHYGHYDATLTFTVANKVLTAVDMTSEGTTVGGKWGVLTPHDGATFVQGYLPNGVQDKTVVDEAARTVKPQLDGVKLYGGSTLSTITLYKDNTDNMIGTLSYSAGGGGRGAAATPAGWKAEPANGIESDFATFDEATGTLTVANTDANLVLVNEKIGTYYVFGQYYGLNDAGKTAARALNAKKTDFSVEATSGGIGAKDRDVYTAAAYSLILQRELKSWLKGLSDEQATDELQDIDIVSAATKSSDSIIEALYATQGYFYPLSNHDTASAEKADWGQIFTSVSDNLKITMDGKTLAPDATAVTKNKSGQYVLTNKLFADEPAVAGFDLYSIDGTLTEAQSWNLGKGQQKSSATATYLTNYTNAIGHGLVGAYGVKPEGSNPYGTKDAVDDVLDDETMNYDPATKALTIKDPSVTHVVVQYAVGKFNSGGVCGVSYDLAALAKASASTTKPATQTIKVSPASKTYALKKVKKAKQTLTVKVSGAKTALTVTPDAKAKKAKITAKASGKTKVKVTVPKKTKKGTYKIKVAAKKSSSYKASSAKTITIKVK